VEMSLSLLGKSWFFLENILNLLVMFLAKMQAYTNVSFQGCMQYKKDVSARWR
jgi:hypothetical protein